MQSHPIGLRRARCNALIRGLRAKDQRSRHEHDKNRKQCPFHTLLFTASVALVSVYLSTDFALGPFVIRHSSFVIFFPLSPPTSAPHRCAALRARPRRPCCLPQ